MSVFPGRNAGSSLPVLIIAPYGIDVAGGQAKAATQLIDCLRKENALNLFHLAIPLRNGQHPIWRMICTFWMVFRLVFIILRRRIRVVHVFTPCHLTGLYEKLLYTSIARILGCTTILNFRNALNHWYEGWSGFHQTCIRLLLRTNTVILCQYKALAYYLVHQLLIPQSKLFVIPNGMCSEEFEAVSSLHRQDRDNVNIIFIGSVGVRKGIDILLKSVSLLQDSTRIPFQVSIYGPTDLPGELEQLRALSEELGLASIVNFHGRLHADKKPAALASADIFVLPSRTEGFPNSLLEAMAAGLPAVVSDRGGMPEIIQNGINGMVFQGESPESLSESLSVMLQNPKMRRSMGFTNKKQVETKYRLRRTSICFTDLYFQFETRHYQIPQSHDTPNDKYEIFHTHSRS